MQIKNVKFGQAVRLPSNKVEAFIDAEAHGVDLFYNPKEQLLYMTGKDGQVKLIGITNIVEMTKGNKAE